MNQQFESDVMQDLMEDSPPASADEYDVADEMEGFEGDGFEGADEMDLYGDAEEEGFYEEGDAYTDEYEEDYDAGGGSLELLEEAMADALDAEDGDEFLAGLLGGVSRVASAIRQGAGTVGRVSRQVSRVAQRTGEMAGQARRIAGQTQRITQRAARARSPAGYLLQRLGQYLNQGFDEFEVLEDMADMFAEEELDEFLPILGGLAARVLANPVIRRAAGRLTQPLRRQLIRSASQAAQSLLRQQGPQALRSLPRIAQSVARTAARQGLPPTALPAAIRRVTAQVAAQPRLVRRLATAPAPAPARPVARQRRPQASGRVAAGRAQRFY